MMKKKIFIDMDEQFNEGDIEQIFNGESVLAEGHSDVSKNHCVPQSKRLQEQMSSVSDNLS